MAFGSNDYDYVSADPINAFDLDGKWKRPKWLKRAWRASGAAAKWLTNSKWGKRINRGCSFAFGGLGAVCGAVYAAAYARQGRYAEAGASALGAVVGGRVSGKVSGAMQRSYERARAASRGRYRLPAYASKSARFYRFGHQFSGWAHGYAVSQGFDYAGRRASGRY